MSILPNILAQEVLQYNLNQGDVFTIKQEAQQAIVQEFEGASHEITNNLSGILEFKVIDKTSDTYILDVTYKDLVLKMTSSIQGELVNVHAQEVDTNDIQSKIFNSLLNVPIQITLAKTGDVLQVVGGDSLVSKMAKASGLTDEFSLNMMKASLKKEFGSEALSNSYKQMTYIYPKKEILVGDTWENNYEGKLSAHNKWQLDSLSIEKATISGMATVVMDIKEPTTTMQLDGTQDTKIITDLKSGFIRTMEVEGFSEGFSTIMQMGEQQIPTSIKSTVTYAIIN
ncbi:MAG: hypothetical protein HKN52_12440 [Eudoraea sp.]|nr:hypothetical protein [Eudoraea sp.]